MSEKDLLSEKINVVSYLTNIDLFTSNSVDSNVEKTEVEIMQQRTVIRKGNNRDLKVYR